MMTETDIIENIRLLRKANDLTQVGLARAASINVKRYNRVEKQRRGLKAIELINIARVLKVDIAFIVSRKLTSTVK